jgi:dTDP-4-dehydrorhamnose 3,5-epimerase
MRILDTEIAGPLIIEPGVHRDSRGLFCETWQLERYRELGIDLPFVQDNVSVSHQGTLRGLHFQSPHPQGKLVYVLGGEIFDVAVDLREGSPTLGRWVSIELSSPGLRQFWIPPGFAHGFCVTSRTAIVAYKCTACYEPSAQHVLAWDDPELAIPWPVRQPLLSEKDRQAPRLKELPSEVFRLTDLAADRCHHASEVLP